MSIHPNHKARHARAERSQIDIPSLGDTFRRFKWFTIGLIVIFPIYPSLYSLSNGSIVRASDYDESTIITAYSDIESTFADDYISDTGLIRVGGGSSGQSTIRQNTQTGSSMMAATQAIRTHRVVSMESIRSISDDYGVSPDAILWANDLESTDELKIGQIIKVPPISGVRYTVVSGDTISEIARHYDVSSRDILQINQLSPDASIRIGMDLMIPGAIKKSSEKITNVPALNTKEQEKNTGIAKGATKKQTGSDAQITLSKPVEISPSTGLKDRYLVKYTGKGRGFVGGNCTWFVAQNKSVTWRGNANAWMRNARAEGVKTGSTPVIGAIIQFSGAGYSRQYGHVGIVAGIEGNTLIIKDMNYRGLYEVTLRKVPMDHPAIDGYIYVD